MPSQFVWYELMTSDAEAAASFYASVVGWEVEIAAGPSGPYTLLKAAGQMCAGVVGLPDEVRRPGARPGWMGYVRVADMDAALAAWTQRGGIVHRPPAEIPGVGPFAVVADPQGAVLTLFAPVDGAPPPPPPLGTPGTFGWHELLAGDGEAVFPFYAEMFGWAKDTPMDMGPMGTYQLFTAGGAPIGAVMTKPASVPAPSWKFYIHVAGIEPAVARIQDAGGQVVAGPMEVPGEQWIVQAIDPLGASFALVGPKSG
jgi:predicted enzyme related to lactoylglutathione lyase